METMMDWLPIVGYGFIGGVAVWFGPRALSFLFVVTGGYNKGNIKKRLAICKECPRVKARDYVDPEGAMTTFLYCDECKCGSHHIAELHTKLGYDRLKCPMGKFCAKSSMTVHEGHDLLVTRSAKERADDQRERTNMMAGRARDDNGPLGNSSQQPENRTAQAQAQLRPTDEAAELQRTRIQKARQASAENQRRKREALSAANHVDKTNKIWGDRGAEAGSADATAPDETTNTDPLAGTDHEGPILVDLKEQSDG